MRLRTIAGVVGGAIMIAGCDQASLPAEPVMKTQPSTPTAKVDPRPASPVTGFSPLDASAEGKRPPRKKSGGGEPRE